MTVGVFVFGAVLAGLLAAIAALDSRKQRIPNWLNASLALSGAAYQLMNGPEAMWNQALLGGAVALLFLAVREGHRRLSGVVGLGLGDVKMAGAGAMWIAPGYVPLFLFVASFSALGFVAASAAAGQPHHRMKRIPFGPFLASGFLIAFCMENLLP